MTNPSFLFSLIQTKTIEEKVAERWKTENNLLPLTRCAPVQWAVLPFGPGQMDLNFDKNNTSKCLSEWADYRHRSVLYCVHWCMFVDTVCDPYEANKDHWAINVVFLVQRKWPRVSLLHFVPIFERNQIQALAVQPHCNTKAPAGCGYQFLSQRRWLFAGLCPSHWHEWTDRSSSDCRWENFICDCHFILFLSKLSFSEHLDSFEKGNSKAVKHILPLYKTANDSRCGGLISKSGQSQKLPPSNGQDYVLLSWGFSSASRKPAFGLNVNTFVR